MKYIYMYKYEVFGKMWALGIDIAGQRFLAV